MSAARDRKRCVLVGSAHVDIFADISGEIDVIDRRGEFTVGIGGTAFNVAANLKTLGLDVALISVLKKNSLFTRIILSKMAEMALSPEGIILDNNDYPGISIGEAGFIAHRHRGELVNAVSSTPIENFSIDAGHFADIIANALFLVIDLNNSLATIKSFLKIEDKPIYILCVSEPKVQKLLSLEADFLKSRIRGIFLNKYEAAKLLQASGIGPEEYEALSQVIDTTWIITRDKDGAILVSRGQVKIQLPAPRIDTVSSYSGAGDAFAAGFLHARHVLECAHDVCALNALLFTKKTLEQLHSNSCDSGILNNVDQVIFQDPMTLLYNRRFYDEEKGHIERSLRRRTNDSVAVAIFDIDSFKSVNDTYGHDVGDTVIRAVAKIIKTSIREKDVAIRYGGEEFLVVFNNGTLETAFAIANRIRTRFSNSPIEHGELILRKTLSGGVAMLTANRGLDDAVKEADLGLYRAKNSGKDRICISHLCPPLQTGSPRGECDDAVTVYK